MPWAVQTISPKGQSVQPGIAQYGAPPGGGDTSVSHADKILGDKVSADTVLFYESQHQLKVCG